ncbi:MAG: hypothetical protein IPO29_00890 [Anaerolineae bacterium]|nr:hypothetical protein [Anaerolineae bacterium]
MQEINHAIYLALASALTLWVAQTLYRSGAVFLMDAFHGDTPRASAVNHLMRVGFCLGNLGFAAVLLGVGRKADTLTGSVEQVSAKLGLVMLALGVAFLIHRGPRAGGGPAGGRGPRGGPGAAAVALATMRQSAGRPQPAHIAMSPPPVPHPAH